ncbi:TRAP transporter substrate-binding protein [Marinomonas sp. IMCC 4694]|uniref:TRAP transporter substrate-binding protein n=1 Tax=Marinomonas sp. IMCC 4694 TaxID=2605432 RepID=UPI0011E85CBA|nr:TRAP transporter substrate-binding protein [Marinomonas sp. IMCC 4694]TYL46904.1 TRAP transporter substrate-binding protein [Marinomonas sp. IMCC 4694]
MTLVSSKPIFNKSIKTKASLGVAVLVTSLSFQAQATTFTLSNWVPPTHFVTTDILNVWAEQVQTATEGRVKIRMLPKPVGTPAQHWELARKGIVDITWGNFTYEPDRFKSIWFAEMPFNGEDVEASSVALWDTYETYLAGNPTYAGVKMLGVGSLGPGVINHGSKAIVSSEDIANQKIRMGGPIQKRLIEELGAVPIAAPATKAYELLAGQVLDGSLHTLESVVNFRLTDQLSHHTLIPGGFYDGTFFLVMNEGKWKRLSAADQATVMSVSGKVFSRLWGQTFQREIDQAYAQLREEGHQFSQPTEEFMAKIGSVRQQMIQDWAAEHDSYGIEQPLEMLDYYRQRYTDLSK